eukprot:1152535-Pelagomonas_calceolata.AAC.1
MSLQHWDSCVPQCQTRCPCHCSIGIHACHSVKHGVHFIAALGFMRATVSNTAFIIGIHACHSVKYGVHVIVALGFMCATVRSLLTGLQQSWQHVSSASLLGMSAFLNQNNNTLPYSLHELIAFYEQASSRTS